MQSNDWFIYTSNVADWMI